MKLVIALCVGIPVLLVGYWVISNLHADHETAQLAQEGASGVVCVLSYADTLVAVNNTPRLRFQLELQPDTGGKRHSARSKEHHLQAGRKC